MGNFVPVEVLQNQVNGYFRIVIRGQVDASSAIILEKVIKDAYDAKRFRILIDCSDLEYISSAGLGVFISFLEDFREVDGNFVFCNMQKNVFDTFQILGLHQIMDILPSENEAIAALYG